MELADAVHDLLLEEPILATAPAPARIFGDLHGQFRDFLALLQDFGFPHELGPTYVCKRLLLTELADARPIAHLYLSAHH